jgi:hypothetical protein
MKNFLIKNKNWIIIGSVAMTLSIIGYFMFKKDDEDSESEDVDINEGNTTEKKSGLIFSKPVTKFKYPLIYVFGGIEYANPDWMLKQVPSYLLSRAFVVFAPYTSSFDSVKKATEKYLSDNDIEINPKKISITGFSAGGLNVQKALSNDFKLVGLIDPSTRSEYLNLPFSNNAVMSYNDSNWTGYPSIRATLPKLDKVINDSSGIGEKVNLGHSAIPKYFFNKYKSKMI